VSFPIAQMVRKLRHSRKPRWPLAFPLINMLHDFTAFVGIPLDYGLHCAKCGRPRSNERFSILSGRYWTFFLLEKATVCCPLTLFWQSPKLLTLLLEFAHSHYNYPLHFNFMIFVFALYCTVLYE